MNTYLVKAKMTTYLLIEVMAENEQEAWEIAEDTDGGDFTEIPYTGGWDITDVSLLEENITEDKA